MTVTTRRRPLLAAAALVMVLAGCTTASGATTPGSASSAPPVPVPKLHVEHAKIVDAGGREVRLLGVNRSGGEFQCVNSGKIWDGPVDTASITAMATWHVRAVRIALNEQCWLGAGTSHPESSGAAYQAAVGEYVHRLEAYGMVPILDLHWTTGTWTGAGSECSADGATCQKPMPDAAHGAEFWASVATAYRDDTSVVFDLFNEPFPNSAGGMSAGQSWDCWLRGGSSCPGLGYEAAGMQQLVDAVRGAGARNVVLVSGNAYANDLTGWLAHRPSDPTGNIGAAWHSYNYEESCVSASCWKKQVEPVVAKVPVVVLEVGQTGCGTGYVGPLMSWLDRRGVGYLGWTWNTWDCSDGPSLITDYDGTPTAYGKAVRAHLLAQS